MEMWRSTPRSTCPQQPQGYHPRTDANLRPTLARYVKLHVGAACTGGQLSRTCPPKATERQRLARDLSCWPAVINIDSRIDLEEFLTCLFIGFSTFSPYRHTCNKHDGTFAASIGVQRQPANADDRRKHPSNVGETPNSLARTSRRWARATTN